MTLHLPELKQTLIGALVEIRRHGQLIGAGTVDNATPTGDIAWIAADGITSRTMIVKADGYDLWTAPTQLQQASNPQNISERR